MKRILQILSLLIVTTLLIPLSTLARDFTYTYEGQTLTYTVLDEDAKTCETKAGTYPQGENNVEGDLVIPEIAKNEDVEYTVTEIGEYSFYNCKGLTSVTIPNSITTIGYRAFMYCGLTSVTIPNSITKIGTDAFADSGLTAIYIDDLEAWCKIDFEERNCGQANPLMQAKHLYINGSEIKNLVIPSSITTLKPFVFYGLNGLISITIPNSVTSIGYSAFCDCDGLTSVTIPNSVTTIGSAAFNHCNNLTSVTIPNSVTTIGSAAFNHCNNLTSVTIPNSITEIEAMVFSNCTSLTSVTIPNSVMTIGAYAFSSCHDLTSVTIPNSVTTIGNDAFWACDGMTSVTIGKSVTAIGRNAFSYGIEDITMLAKCTLDVSGMSQLKVLTVFKDATVVGWNKPFFNVVSQATEAFATFNITPNSGSGITLKIINDNGKEISIKDAVSIYSGESYRWDGDELIIKSNGPGALCGFHLVENYECHTKDITVEVHQIAEFADMAKVSATIDAGDFIPQDYYWDYDEIHALNADIPWPRERVFFIIEGYDGYKRESPVLRLTYPEPELTEEEAVATALDKARLMARCNLSNGAIAGIEWRRSDAPDDVKSNEAKCPVVAGQLMGELKGLRDNVYYKFRPFYERGDKKYYGEWVGFYTGDAGVYFEPEVGTLPATVTSTGVGLEGYAYAGTDDISTAGFEYRRAEAQTRSGDGWHSVEAQSNTYITVTLDNLDSGTKYEYRVFAVAGGKTYYGDTGEFTTPGDPVGIRDIESAHGSMLDAVLICDPAGGAPRVRVTTAEGDAKCMIHSLDGRLIHNGEIVADGSIQEIDVRLDSGLYILNIIGRSGRATFRMIAK